MATTIAFNAERVSGGFWFLPDSLNQSIGHVVFGVSGVLSFGVAGLALRDTRASAVAPRAHDDDDALS